MVWKKGKLEGTQTGDRRRHTKKKEKKMIISGKGEKRERWYKGERGGVRNRERCEVGGRYSMKRSGILWKVEYQVNKCGSNDGQITLMVRLQFGIKELFLMPNAATPRNIIRTRNEITEEEENWALSCMVEGRIESQVFRLSSLSSPPISLSSVVLLLLLLPIAIFTKLWSCVLHVSLSLALLSLFMFAQSG